MRLFAACWFLYACHVTRRTFKTKKAFFVKLTITGALWLVALPLSVLLAYVVSDVDRRATKGCFHCHLPTLSVFSDQIGIKKNASTLRETLRRDDHLGPNEMSF